MRSLDLPYRWNGVAGTVRVHLGRNDDPTALGCPEGARGFPVCRAQIEVDGLGYQHLGGWIQVVDWGGEEQTSFANDQYPPLATGDHPFVLVGYSPILFDAPFEFERDSFEFVAHTFYCGFGGELLEFRREACAVLGFTWGFWKTGARVESFGPTALAPSDWDGHRPFLSRLYPDWTFAPGFSDSPQRR
jgi:hypothetical protein